MWIIFRAVIFLCAVYHCKSQATYNFKHKSPYLEEVDRYVHDIVGELRQEVSNLKKELNTANDKIQELEREIAKDQLQLDALVFYSRDYFRLYYTIENFVENVEPHFNETIQFNNSKIGAFFTYFMEEAAKLNPDFNFTYTVHPLYGWFITSINGLYWDSGAHLYWAFLKRYDSGEVCAMNVGVSSYIPKPDPLFSREASTYTIVFQYKSWDDPPLPGCTGPPHE